MKLFTIVFMEAENRHHQHHHLKPGLAESAPGQFASTERACDKDRPNYDKKVVSILKAGKPVSVTVKLLVFTAANLVGSSS